MLALKEDLKNSDYCFVFFAEMEASKNQIDTDKKAIDELVRERDILNKVCVSVCGLMSLTWK